MLRKMIYPKIEGKIQKAARWLADKGFTPNQLTLAGLGFNAIAGYFFAQGHLFAGFLVAAFAGFGDMLDGAVARMTGQVTKFGAFLDSSVDRYSDFFLVGGLALHFARTGQNGALVLSLGVILGSFCVSYTKARAENFIPHCGVGLFDRGLRIVLLLLGTLITPLLKPILWILLLGSHATAIQRILHTRNALAKPLEEPGA